MTQVIPAACIAEQSGSNIVATENLSSFRILNPKNLTIRKIAIDNCVVKNQLACDYLFIVPTEPNEWYVELKGSNILHAIDQLKATITMMTADKAKPKLCFIVSTKCPLMNTQTQVLTAGLKKSHNATLRIKNRVCEVPI